MDLSSEFESYPFLSVEEFTEVCHHLDRRYCQATLGPVRRQWKLRCCSTLNTTNALGPEYTTFIQIVRPLDGELDDGDLSSILDYLSFDTRESSGLSTTQDAVMMEAEEADEVRHRRMRQLTSPGRYCLTLALRQPSSRSLCLILDMSCTRSTGTQPIGLLVCGSPCEGCLHMSPPLTSTPSSGASFRISSRRDSVMQAPLAAYRSM